MRWIYRLFSWFLGWPLIAILSLLASVLFHLDTDLGKRLGRDMLNEFVSGEMDGTLHAGYIEQLRLWRTVVKDTFVYDPDGRAIIYGEIGVLASQDQANAARVMREWPFIDASRIGIWGWSGGGSMTLNMMFRHPDIYHTGMSVAPVPDQRLYDTIYQERYMSTPQDNPAGYEACSPRASVAPRTAAIAVDGPVRQPRQEQPRRGARAHHHGADDGPKPPLGVPRRLGVPEDWRRRDGPRRPGGGLDFGLAQLDPHDAGFLKTHLHFANEI